MRTTTRKIRRPRLHLFLCQNHPHPHNHVTLFFAFHFHLSDTSAVIAQKVTGGIGKVLISRQKDRHQIIFSRIFLIERLQPLARRGVLLFGTGEPNLNDPALISDMNFRPFITPLLTNRFLF